MNKWNEDDELRSLEVNAQLDDELRAMDFGDTRLYFVHGYPRSDIGKGHLVARLAGLRQNSSIIKYDGFLNTNRDARYPSRTRYDFVVYKKFKPDIEFGGAHHIIAGQLLYSFLTKYGETHDHLMFVPHVSKIFALTVFENWLKLGRPKELFIEIGGTADDIEVSSFALPGTALLKARNKNTKSFILTECAYNGEYIKTKVLQSALRTSLKYGIVHDVVFVREPNDYPKGRQDTEIEKYIEIKISNSLVYGGLSPRVILIPQFSPPDLSGYELYLSGRARDIFS